MQYWDCVNKRMSGEYTGIQCFVHASLIKNHLETQWNLRKWDGDQLTWICDALNVKYEPLNPNYFINDRVVYMNHLQNFYYLGKKMDEYTLYKAYEEGHYIHEIGLCKVVNYISGQLISWSPNRSFSEDEFNEVLKLFIVCKWKRKRSLPLLTKKVTQFAMIN